MDLSIILTPEIIIPIKDRLVNTGTRIEPMNLAGLVIFAVDGKISLD